MAWQNQQNSALNFVNLFSEKSRFLQSKPLSKNVPNAFESIHFRKISGSNPISYSENSFCIYGLKEKIRALKSPETVDAPDFRQAHLKCCNFMVDLIGFEPTTPTMRM